MRKNTQKSNDDKFDYYYGIWKYFTVNDGNIQLDKENYLLIGTLEAYTKIRDYFGKENTLTNRLLYIIYFLF